MKDIQEFKKPILFSILLHIVIFSLLFINFSTPKITPPTEVKVIQATAINETQLQTTNISAPIPKPAPTQDTIREIEKVALKEAEKPIPEKVVQPVIEKPLPQPTKKPKVEALRNDQNFELQEPNLEEKIAQKKIQAEKRKAELKKKEEQLAKKQREEEASQLKKELASETKQNTAKKVMTDEEMAEEIGEEQKQLSSSEAALNEAGEIDKYKQMIIKAVSRKWVILETEDKDLTCQLLVHLGPGGIVLSVDTVKESGDLNLDRSARNAIMKASPLPVPEKAELFDNFRALRLTFRPQGVISE